MEDNRTQSELAEAARKKHTPEEWLDSLTSAERKEFAVFQGFKRYFPLAMMLIARHSVRMNEKHNPGEPVHWAKEKSKDHDDCIERHGISIAINPDSVDSDGAYHMICRGWRAMAAIEIWAEAKLAKGEKL